MISDDRGPQIRGELLRTRVMVAYALCAIAESELHARQITMAGRTVDAINRIIQEVVASVHHPGHLSPDTAQTLDGFRSELDHRARNIAMAIQLLGKGDMVSQEISANQVAPSRVRITLAGKSVQENVPCQGTSSLVPQEPIDESGFSPSGWV